MWDLGSTYSHIHVTLALAASCIGFGLYYTGRWSRGLRRRPGRREFRVSR